MYDVRDKTAKSGWSIQAILELINKMICSNGVYLTRGKVKALVESTSETANDFPLNGKILTDPGSIASWKANGQFDNNPPHRLDLILKVIPLEYDQNNIVDIDATIKKADDIMDDDYMKNIKALCELHYLPPSLPGLE